jgi:TonB family protein
MVIFLKGQNASINDSSYNRFFVASIIAHGIVIACIFWLLQSRYYNKPLHLPKTITLVSLPVIEINNKTPSAPPQRVQTASVPKKNPSPVVAQPIEPTASANPSTNEMNPVPSTTQSLKEQQTQSGQSGTASGSSSGGSSEGTSDGTEAIRIGYAQTLDNVGFSPLYNPKPAYPPFALKAGIQGFVEVDLIINEFGRVESFTIAKVVGHPTFGDETAKVIGKWRFPPPRVEGKKIKIKFLYTVNFKLD